MEGYDVKQIKNLFEVEIDHLLNESKEEGFLFLERLVNEYKNGTNTFTKPGEALYGVFNKDGEIIAIGGLNKDPFSNESSIGRLRRFYVSKNYRRNGIGSLLLKKILCDVKKYFTTIVLHTDTEQADRFYTSRGFCKENNMINATHYIKL
ncbi:GNAT family N-acetyltransferase [Heyndrickxia sp. NPDC080065]|uniref:GNAT family N-acetyltransferase n=1 Tax=Heyndrickxia sp. NPDC080065 TaxID=3390568 RepID=UPI003CFFDEA4